MLLSVTEFLVMTGGAWEGGNPALNHAAADRSLSTLYYWKPEGTWVQAGHPKVGIGRKSLWRPYLSLACLLSYGFFTLKNKT